MFFLILIFGVFLASTPFGAYVVSWACARFGSRRSEHGKVGTSGSDSANDSRRASE